MLYVVIGFLGFVGLVAFFNHLGLRDAEPASRETVPAPQEERFPPIEIADPYRSEATEKEFTAVSKRLGAKSVKFIFGTRKVRTEDGCQSFTDFRECRLDGPYFWIRLRLRGAEALHLMAEGRDGTSEKGEFYHKISRLVVWDASGNELGAFMETEAGNLNHACMDEIKIGSFHWSSDEDRWLTMRFLVRVESETGKSECLAVTASLVDDRFRSGR